MKTILLIALGVFIGWYVTSHDEVWGNMKTSAQHGAERTGKAVKALTE
jgi:hypothetical protein